METSGDKGALRERAPNAAAVDDSALHEHATVEAPFPPPGEAPERISSLDPARERRVKALTCTEPLHSLQTNRGRRGWEGFDFYDLGLAAIDAVVARMGFDTGITPESLDAPLMV